MQGENWAKYAAYCVEGHGHGCRGGDGQPGAIAIFGQGVVFVVGSRKAPAHFSPGIWHEYLALLPALPLADETGFGGDDPPRPQFQSNLASALPRRQ